MPIETAAYINGLDPTNPLGIDLFRQGDDHIRLIKNALLATFPNIGGAVSATVSELNLLSGQTVGAAMPAGARRLFYSAAVPTGWLLDIAANDRAIILATSGNNTGGSWVISGISFGGTALTLGNLAAHSHTIDDYVHGHEVPVGFTAGDSGAFKAASASTTYVFSHAMSSAGAHTHAVANTGGGVAHTHPGLQSSDGSSWRMANVSTIIGTKS